MFVCLDLYYDGYQQKMDYLFTFKSLFSQILEITDGSARNKSYSRVVVVIRYISEPLK